MSSTAERQNRLRKEILYKREKLSPDIVNNHSVKILDVLTHMRLYLEADTILVYASVRNEVSTQAFIRDSIARGKQTAVPKVIGKHEMIFLPITDPAELKAGFFGIPEPSLDDKMPCSRGLMIMPGLVFDRKCSRIGYGGGFYDAFIRQHGDHLTTLALAYDFQIQEELLPVQPWDQNPQMILTPTRLITADTVTFH